jgi:hypothetical protein
MNWFSLTIIALGLILGYSKHSEQSKTSTAPENSDKIKKAVKIKPEKSGQSDDLNGLIDATKRPLEPNERHRLLTKIIEKTYKQRTDVCMKKIFHRFARIHLNEFPDLAPALKTAHRGSLPHIPTFKLSAMVFEEEENYQAAMGVCKMALEYGIDDGTKSGFSGRLKRLQKKQQALQP